MTAEGSIHPRFLRLGPYVVDVSSGEVKKNGERLHLPEQPTRLLLALLERPGEIVSREELRSRLWANDTNVEFNHGIHAAINKLRQALGDSPEQPQFIETIPRRGYRLVSSPTPTTDAEIEPTQRSAHALASRVWLNRDGLLAAGTLLLVLIAVTATWLHFKTKGKSHSASVAPPVLTVPVPRRIAIVGFRNLSNRNEGDWLSLAFAEMLATELGTSAELRPVSGEDVAQMKRELSLANSDSYTQESLRKIQQNLGADVVVAGSFMPIGQGNPDDAVRFDIHLQNTSTGQTIASLSETGKVKNLFDLISDAGLHLRMELGATPLSSSEQAEIRRAMPANNAAQGLYFLGLEKLRNFDYPGARQILVKAVAADPDNSLSHAALSMAYGASGYQSLAAKEATLAFDLAKGLTYEQGLQVDGRYHETKHEWARAEEAYQRLCSLSPHDIDSVLRLAHVQSLDGKAKDAIATLEHLPAVVRSARDSARIQLAVASAQQQLGDSNKELAAAKAAAALGEQAHALLVIAIALRMQGVAQGYLGDNTQALNDAHQAERIFETLNVPGGLVDTLIDEGDVLSDLGDMGAAETVWRRALGLARDTAEKQKEAVVSNNLGNILLMQGEPEQARTMYQRSYELFLEVDDKVGQANSLLTIGDALQDEGWLSQARESYEQALRLSTKVANQEVKAEALECLAGVLADLGDPAQAKRTAQEALAAAQASGDKPTEAAALIYLGQATVAQGSLVEAQSIARKAMSNADALAAKSLQAGSRILMAQILSLQGDTSAARATYEQALALEESTKASTEERETRYALAQLALEERPSDAREMLRLMQAKLKPTQHVDVELECLILQTELELLDKQNDAALGTALRAQSVSGHDERFDLKMSAAEVFVKAAAASQKWTQADQVVRSSLLRASQSGCFACELKVKFFECGLKAEKDASDASVCFEKLQRTAERKGFGRIAKDAASKARSSRS